MSWSLPYVTCYESHCIVRARLAVDYLIIDKSRISPPRNSFAKALWTRWVRLTRLAWVHQ